jgi:hypothetical protein
MIGELGKAMQIHRLGVALVSKNSLMEDHNNKIQD